MAQTPGSDLDRTASEPTAAALAQLALLGLLSVTVGLGALGWLAGIGYALLGWAAVTAAKQRYGVRSVGPAGRVTLARATLVGGVTALVADRVSQGWPLAALLTLATVALLLDAIDGQVARRTGTSSPLGARFDMEVDSFLVLVLSIFVAAVLGWWVLAIGGFRYAFGLAAWAAPWLRAPLPPSLARKTVAALQGIVLVVATAGMLPRPLALLVVGLSLMVLTASFGRDIWWLRSQATRLTSDLAGPPRW